MRLPIFLMALMISISASAQTLSAKICEPSLKANHPIFQTALDNLYSFSYVRKALEAAKEGIEKPIYCTSMVALATNAYGYYHYYIEIEVISSASTGRRFHFLFQDASVQAFHNVGGQPWVGLDSVYVQNTAQQLIESSRFLRLASGNEVFDWLALTKKSKTYQAHAANLNPETLSVVQLPETQSDSKFYLVTWMAAQQTSNPFIAPLITQGILLRLNADQTIDIAENIFPGSDWLFPMQANVQLIRNSLIDDLQAWVAQLLKMSSSL